jgi:antitoxin MazE
MTLHVQKWGNSLALRIPKQVAKEAHLKEGSEVNVTEQSGRIILDPVEREVTLSELLEKVTSENLHDEQDFGAPQGKEIW